MTNISQVLLDAAAAAAAAAQPINCHWSCQFMATAVEAS
jgi:hypothetical protein